jgi:hypothetical protein
MQKIEETSSRRPALSSLRCSLHLDDDMPESDRTVLRAGLECTGIELRADAPLQLYALERYSLTPRTHACLAPGALAMLRVRQRGTLPAQRLDWTSSLVGDLAVWILTYPPPARSTVDLVIPALPVGAKPKAASGLLDEFHIWIWARTDDAALDEATRHWTRKTVDAMSERWSTGSAACACC